MWSDTTLVSGEADYMLEVVVADLEHYQRFLLGKLLELAIVKEVRSNIAIQTLKAAAKLPLDHLLASSGEGEGRAAGAEQATAKLRR